jgi:hemerythrin-like metal-binding protein
MMILKERNNALVTISDEHAHLVDLLGALSDAVAEEPADPERVAEILDDVLAESAGHFKHEELLMLETGYPHYIDHQKNHEQILDAIRGLITRSRMNEMGSVSKTKELIEQWMLAHMKKFDEGLIRSLSK